MKRISKRNIGKIAAFLLLLNYSSSLSAQTYKHESAIMNQFTVMEIGAGSLTPREYYNLTHKNYQKSATLTNKQSFRTKTQQNMLKEISLAENVDSVLSRRAMVEAMNIANRSRSCRCGLAAGKGKARRSHEQLPAEHQQDDPRWWNF